jgi:hypothetical protein
MAEDMFRQIHKANSNVDMDFTADIYKRRLRLHQEWATATRGRVQLVITKRTHIKYVYFLDLKYFLRPNWWSMRTILAKGKEEHRKTMNQYKYKSEMK